MKQLIKTLLKEKDLSKRKVEELKKQWAKDHNKGKIPLNSEIYLACNESEKKKLRRLLVTKPTRTISGVSVIAAMIKPSECPGKCIYCPQGYENKEFVAPKSYTGYEPAAMRARLNDFDAYKQVTNRLKQLNNIGHSTEKNELIIMGGTLPAMPWKYQVEFVKGCFDGFNGKKSKTLLEAHKINETAKNRVIGMTLETRPDYVFPEKFLELGATRVELGVQTVYDSIFKKVKRGHGTKEVKEATKALKDNCFKVLYHMMPGLPGSTFEKDVAMFKKLFSDSNYKPDMLKIYPTLVIKGTALYDWWKQGKYVAINEKYMTRLLKEVYKIAPKWVRIMRVQRDIPAKFIEAGPVKSNLREVVLKNLKKSKEIRFREAGHSYLKKGKVAENVEILVEKYNASSGAEYFISAEDVKQDILLGFCRLRISKRKEGMIRELHVYGNVEAIGKKGKDVQHRGFGRKLMERAEEIAMKKGKKEMIVISGIGVREYYRKLGYKLKGSYMFKSI
ncbi:tRNA uridine(34) 5-carboxymethylaminomethyl modification radical SAM/GNAT enzyme Elp3 [Candidatus Pacearchaeota archaeon]|nr:tRNA uridine(34) 5-carboxymethylaminomethyl modification radical SAM/GNAT enzyme Elp3 [Candidatus Pacearchaeota archaeon]